ncbi:alpha/beta fold hydrolase [Myxococcus vastator]|uniref:alpha/beta fold hydrolase n=1 Tax=Myxococcus vastator TaxID=2709664 RepID=UPI0013D00A0F|nr:alpha/beta hydrolase [Myxococcus vastator]
MVLESFLVGEGDVPTVMLHGFLGTGRNLRSLAAAWSAADPSRRILLPDLTGHGTSPALPANSDLYSMARDVVDTARAQGFQGPFDWVGHSLGGRVTLAASLNVPEAVRSVSLLDIAPGPVPGDLSESGKVLGILLQAPAQAENRRAMRAELTGRGLSESLADWLLMNLVTEEHGVRWRFDRQGLADLHSRVNDTDLWAAVERQDGPPTRGLRGGRSKYVSDADVERLVAAGCPVETLPEAGHFVHVEAPQAVLAWLR